MQFREAIHNEHSHWHCQRLCSFLWDKLSWIVGIAAYQARLAVIHAVGVGVYAIALAHHPGIAGHVFKQYQPFAALGFVGIHQGQLRLVTQNFNNGALTQINLRARHAHGGVVQILDVVGCIHRPGLGRVGAGIGHIVHLLGQRGAVAVLLGGDDDGIGADLVKLCLEGEIARGVQAGGVQILIGRGNGDRSARNGGAADGH